ncbi:FAD-dependent monooxygenase [Tsukamurella strandjordii]|uniref:FAD-dependent monooxygenase n=1 Tax=Tsukamurella TaxID=2060 RepID=UPI00207E19BA|nr:FAD-dependent monooxygenase [Tsukamurella sp. TY48]GIZ96876.1 monooxygenase [Tsukamurella sp. TY48]
MWRTNSLRVAVVGAGIGGLAVAAGLQRAGAEVIVLEQAARFLPRGSGLSLFGNGFTALRSLGLEERVRAVTADGPPQIPVGTRTVDGTRVTTFRPETAAELRVVDRTELHKTLLAALIPDTVRPGIRVEGVNRDTVDLGPSGLLSYAHVIVGADGIRSRVRGSYAGDPGAAYCGYGAWRGITSEPVALEDAGETFGRGERFGYVPLRDGRVYWFAVRPSTADDEPEPGELLDRFGAWHDPIPELIAATEPKRIGYQPIERLAHPLRTYSRGQATLVGDAAHAMPPTLGQGANLALEDAAVLVSLLRPLASDPDPRAVPVALTDYDKQRRRRTQRIARQAHLLGTAGQWPNPAVAFGRDTALRFAPDGVIDYALRRIQQWSPPQ